MKEFTIHKNDCGQRLDRFLTKQGLSISVIMKTLRKKDIKVNKIRQPADYKLAENDVVRVFLDDRFFADSHKDKLKFENISTNLNIVYEDDNIILIDKPVGLLCHYGVCKTSDTLINRVKAYLYKKGEFDPQNEHSFEPSLCNRIDRNTCGIVIAAKNAASLRIMNEKIKLRQIRKVYLCVLSRVPDKKEATLTAYLEKDSDPDKNNPVKVTDRKSDTNKTIVTKYRVLDERGGLALAEIDLLTGRTHQIRAHMAYIGCPLVGDGKYGRNKVNKKFPLFGNRQALCSYRLEFRFESDGENDSRLDYLNGKQFEAGNVWFLEKFYSINKE